MSYIVHKAVEFDKVTAKAKKALAQRIGVLPGSVDDLSPHFIAQAKYDGVNGVAILKGNERQMLSRTGEVAKSCDHILNFLYGILGKDYVALGEVWHPKRKQSDTSGDFRRHSPSPHLTFAVFDLLTTEEFAAGKSERRFEDRVRKLHEKLYDRAGMSDPAFVAATYHAGTYGSATDLAALCGAKGPSGGGWYDGAVLRDPEGIWTAGSGTTGEIIKVKPRQTFDVRVLGVNEGLGKNAGTCGSLTCQGPQKTFTVRGCVTDTVAASWWATPEIIVDKIIEVECLGITDDGSLREPVMLNVRYDKLEADF